MVVECGKCFRMSYVIIFNIINSNKMQCLLEYFNDKMDTLLINFRIFANKHFSKINDYGK